MVVESTAGKKQQPNMMGETKCKHGNVLAKQQSTQQKAHTAVVMA